MPPYFEPPLAIVLPGMMTVDTLPTPSADNVGRYALVSDLFGEKRDYVLCSSVGQKYFWQPVRPIYAKSASADQNMVLTPLKTPSVLYFTGAPVGTRALNLSTNLVYPGASFELAFDGSLGLGSLTLSGLILGSTLSMALGGRTRVFYDADAGGWKKFQ